MSDEKVCNSCSSESCSSDACGGNGASQENLDEFFPLSFEV